MGRRQEKEKVSVVFADDSNNHEDRNHSAALISLKKRNHNVHSTPASYDLHLHTYWSYDATAEPELYFRQARKLGVKCLAITEHHNIDSVPELESLAGQYPELRMIRSAELTVTTSIGSVDLLCYNLPREPTGLLTQVFQEYHEWQRAAGTKKSQGMQAMGYDYSEKDRLQLLRSYRPERVIARQGATHVKWSVEMEYFRERGYLSPEETPFNLIERIPAEFRGPSYPDAHRVTAAVKEAGGLVVIAHPTGYFLRNDVARMDALRQECNLDGIECAHPNVPPELTEFYRAYCCQHGLISTAGSDSHTAENILTPPEGWEHSSSSRFACHLGEEAWLEEFLERLP